MRITSFAVLTLLACGAAFAGSRSETTTYVDGNLTGISPDTGATLSLADDSGITLRTGLGTVAIPYSGISHVELGAVKETTHGVPLYKVWALRKRFAPKTETQLLIVNFKNEAGEDKNMTLELAKSSAQNVLSTIQSRTGEHTDVAASPSTMKQGAASSNDWWGDRYWKTKNNTDRWSKPPVTNAPDQQ